MALDNGLLFKVVSKQTSVGKRKQKILFGHDNNNVPQTQWQNTSLWSTLHKIMIGQLLCAGLC